MSYRAKWQNFRERDWVEVRDSWLAHVPNFTAVGARPDPGLEHLPSLLAITLPDAKGPAARLPDVEGIRRNALWEAVFLFHKCSHTNLAAQRIGQQGMHSWCMFNAYHSAYLGARGMMALLGVALPKLRGEQVAFDLFPEPPKKKAIRVLGSPQFQEFIIFKLPQLDQRYLWEAFQRVLRMSRAPCIDEGLRNELLNLSYEEISPPRNHFLYKAHFWPLEDLASDGEVTDLDTLVGTELHTEDSAFLLRLSFSVYHLFEQLMGDIGVYSGVIKNQFDGSRFFSASELPELGRYKIFLSQISSQAGTPH